MALAGKLIGRVKKRQNPTDSFRQGLAGLLTAQMPQQQMPQQGVPSKPLYQMPQQQVAAKPLPTTLTNVAAPYGLPPTDSRQARRGLMTRGAQTLGTRNALMSGQPSAFQGRVNALMGLFRRPS